MAPSADGHPQGGATFNSLASYGSGEEALSGSGILGGKRAAGEEVVGAEDHAAHREVAILEDVINLFRIVEKRDRVVEGRHADDAEVTKQL